MLLLKGLTTTVRPEDQRSLDVEEEEANFLAVAAVWEGAKEEVVACLLVALAIPILII